MPKVEKISHADIYFGMSTFERTSRIDPSTTTTRTMVNARHVPYSGTVSATTVAGGIDALNAVVSGAVRIDFVTNRTAISGIVLSNSVANRTAISGLHSTKIGNAGVTGSGWRMDAGNTAWSGWIKAAVSTALSSINSLVVSPVRSSGWVNADYSGVLAEHISYSKSGHCFDLYRHCIVSGGTAAGIVTSGGISGVVSWMAMGI